VQQRRLYLSGKAVGAGQAGRLKHLPSVNRPGTSRYELRVASPAEKLAPLRKLEQVQDATLFGETIHLLVSDETPVQKILAAAGIVIDEHANSRGRGRRWKMSL